MDKGIIAECEDKGTKYCILENDGIALCVCKHRPCEQLKRLQAEYDDLHLTYAGCKTANTGLQELNDKLQAENERLKEKYNVASYECNNLRELKTKYRQALQEIREICKNSHTSASEDYYRTADKIQAKINEVIGAEE